MVLGLPARFSGGSTGDRHSWGTQNLWVLSGEGRQSVGVGSSTVVVVGSLQVLAGYSWRRGGGRGGLWRFIFLICLFLMEIRV